VDLRRRDPLLVAALDGAAVSAHAASPAHPAGAAPPRSIELRLWTALIAAPVAWSIAEIAGVALIGRRCEPAQGLEPWRWTSLLAITVAAAVVLAASAALAYGALRRGREPAQLPAAGRVDFMARLALLVSLLLFFNIVLFGLAPLIVDPCVGARVS
jgi:hypothetical protein